ncbi:MAG: hypothetical protein ACI80K_002086, partial [Paracoccaceae bacterium]
TAALPVGPAQEKQAGSCHRWGTRGRSSGVFAPNDLLPAT